MKTSSSSASLLRLVVCLLSLPLAALLARATPTTTQSVTLNPGWNAIHLEVVPENPDLSAVFDGVPVDSVWAYGNNLGQPDFVAEVTETALAKAGWFSWVPTNRVDAFQNNLFQVQVNRSYLVKLAGTAAATLTLSGRPTTRTRAWLPDSYNFRGLPVDPAVPPTFLSFFRPSAAHYATTTGLGAMYRLDAAGVWQRIVGTDLVRRGEAYWIWCRGGSDYVAPFVAVPVFGDGLEFTLAADEVELELKNLGPAALNATVRDLGAPTTNPLSYAQRLSDQTLTWPGLPTPWVRAVPVGAAQRERIAVRRADMAADLFETVLEITDGLGSRHLLPVSVTRSAAPVGTAAGAGSHVGLWVGTASLNAVSEAHSGALTTNVSSGFTVVLETNAVSKIVTTNRVPNSVTRANVSMATTPTSSELNLRLLLHVDAAGQTRLLKEVIEMWQDGTTTNDASGTAIIDRPGRYVLLTDDSLVGKYTGISARDGVPVGRRLSTAGFDFADNELPMAGVFDIGSSVVATNTMSDTFARNPFKHRYHPDHQKGFSIRRVIGLEFGAAPPNAPPGYGERVLDGIYRETVSGLHRTNIVVTGTFRLNRVANTPVLNQ